MNTAFLVMDTSAVCTPSANDLIGSMSKEQLLNLKDSVEAHDPQTLDFFGIDSDDTADAPKLSLKKRL